MAAFPVETQVCQRKYLADVPCASSSCLPPNPANFSLPEKCDYIDEVLYHALAKEEAQPLVTKYKEEARKLLPPSEKRTNRRNNRNKRNRQNRNRGQGYGEALQMARAAPLQGSSGGPLSLVEDRLRDPRF